VCKDRGMCIYNCSWAGWGENKSKDMPLLQSFPKKKKVGEKKMYFRSR
jgi:hypothetical protein